jgi:hypothetical protein
MDDIKDKYDEILKAITDKLEEAKEEASNLFEHGEGKAEISKGASKAISS